MSSRFAATPFARMAFFGLLCTTTFLGCGDDDNGPSPEAELTAAIRASYTLEAMPESIPYPPDNPAVQERIDLGRLLFFDPVLSGDDDVACGTCHHPAFAWADGRDLSIGVGGQGIGPDRVRTLGLGSETEFFTPRNSPTVLDTAFNAPFGGDQPWQGKMFWDGRSTSLEAQAQAPIRSRDEMRHEVYTAPEALGAVIAELKTIPEYVQLFLAAFPAEAAGLAVGEEAEIIDGVNYSRALGAYERELCTPDSPFDQFVRGDDRALSYAQKQGLDLFWRKGCVNCHGGPMFSDFGFRALGVKQEGPGRPPLHETGDGSDLGRFAETGELQDLYAFRTPSLRNVALTAPYFHTGGNGTGGDYQTLRQAVEFFARGGGDEEFDGVDVHPYLQTVSLSDEEIDRIVDFLHSLTATRLLSDRVDPTVPATVPSGLTPPPVLEPVLRF